MIIKDTFGLTSDGELIIPRGNSNMPPVAIEMRTILEAESRIEEIRRSSDKTLPDLVTVFLIALGKLANSIAVVELELREAKRLLDEAKAIALLEKAEELLKSKGIKSSADTREAAILLDPQVRECQARVDALTATQAFLYNKNALMDRAYHGAKKICDVYMKTPYSKVYGGEENG